MVIEHAVEDRYHGISMQYEKSKSVTSKTSVYTTSVDPQRHRCELVRCRTMRMLILLVSPRVTRSTPRDVGHPYVTSVSPCWSVKCVSGSISADSSGARHVSTTPHLYPSPARVSILLLSRITVLRGMSILSGRMANQSIVYVKSIICTKPASHVSNVPLCYSVIRS